MIPFLLSLWIVIILIFNYADWKITKNGGKPDYLLYFLFRGGAAIIHGTLCLIAFEDRYYTYGNLSSWQLLLIWLPYLIYQVTSFWIVYELVRNFWSQQPLLYFDTVEHDSGVVDKIFAKLGHSFHAYAKVIALVVCVISVLVIAYRH